MSPDIQLEGILFYKASAVSKKELQKLLDVDETALSEAITRLSSRLTQSAQRLLITETAVQLVTAPELDELIERLRRDELKRDIGKAGAETLAIILYREPITRAEIEQIRGVNSGFILRNLLVRGLIAKETEKNYARYRITPDLLASLGITNKTELPEYGPILTKIDTFLTANHEQAQ